MIKLMFQQELMLIKQVYQSRVISLISKNEAINLMQNAHLIEKQRNIIKHKNLLSDIKKSKKIVTFEDIEIEKNKFYRHKTPVPLRDVDIEKVFVFNKISFGERTK